jgi:hypothetical protein
LYHELVVCVEFIEKLPDVILGFYQQLVRSFGTAIASLLKKIISKLETR